jgi:hypothetical protein
MGAVARRQEATYPAAGRDETSSIRTLVNGTDNKIIRQEIR